jgi:hypothetical protein
MLAARGGASLLLLSRGDLPPGPDDPELEALCRRVLHLRITPPGPPAPPPPPGGTPRLVCTPEQVPGALERFFREEGAGTLFVFRPETYFLMEGALPRFPRRFLDLDESGYRRMQNIDRLRAAQEGAAPDPARRRAHAVARPT